MSNALTTAARPLAMDPSAKAVLMALCDMAREPDDPDRPSEAWPPIRGQDGAIGLCEWTCLSERSVQRGMKLLLAAGHVTRRQLRHGVLYTVHPKAGASTPVKLTPDKMTGDKMTPVNMAPTPVILAPKAQQSTSKREKTTSPLSVRQSSSTERGSRLAPDFEIPEDWIAWAASDRGWTHDDAAREAANFRDYWIAQPGARGRKADWPATWRVWVRKSHRRPTAAAEDFPTVRAAERAMAMIQNRDQ